MGLAGALESGVESGVMMGMDGGVLDYEKLACTTFEGCWRRSRRRVAHNTTLV